MAIENEIEYSAKSSPFFSTLTIWRQFISHFFLNTYQSWKETCMKIFTTSNYKSFRDTTKNHNLEIN